MNAEVTVLARRAVKRAKDKNGNLDLACKYFKAALRKANWTVTADAQRELLQAVWS